MGPLTFPPSLPILIANVLVYAALLLQSARLLRSDDSDKLRSFPRLICLSVLFRLTWFVSEYLGWGASVDCHDWEILVNFCGRCAQASLFTAFSAVLFFWWEILISEQRQASSIVSSPPETSFRELCCRPSTWQILINFWVYVVLLGLVWYKFESCDEDVRSGISQAEVVAIALFYLCLAIGFCYVCVGLSRQLQLRESVSSTQLQRRILIISTLCVLFFSLRSLLFLLNPLFGVVLKGTAREVLYPWFFYTVPEVLPALVAQWFMFRQKRATVALADALVVQPEYQSGNNGDALAVWRM